MIKYKFKGDNIIIIEEKIIDYILDYKIQDKEKLSSTIDFNIKEDREYKLFNDIENIQSYSQELRKNGWK